MILSIAIERASGRSFYDLVDEVVLGPADMRDTAFDRSDRLPADTALGYLEDGRTNVLHLPVRGVGDGGAATTVRDLESFWRTLFAGRILPMPAVERLIAPRSDVPAEGSRYGLGFWLAADGPAVALEGMDAGVSARTVYDPRPRSGSRSSRTRRPGPGRSSNCSTSGSRPGGRIDYGCSAANAAT